MAFIILTSLHWSFLYFLAKHAVISPIEVLPRIVLCYYWSACLLLQLQIVLNRKNAIWNTKLCLRPQGMSYRELSVSQPVSEPWQLASNFTGKHNQCVTQWLIPKTLRTLSSVVCVFLEKCTSYFIYRSAAIWLRCTVLYTRWSPLSLASACTAHATSVSFNPYRNNGDRDVTSKEGSQDVTHSHSYSHWSHYKIIC
jgi:hypothetical protein